MGLFKHIHRFPYNKEIYDAKRVDTKRMNDTVMIENFIKYEGTR